MKAHGKGLGIGINTSTAKPRSEWLAKMTDGIPEREFKPLKITRAMEIAVERCKELTAIRNRFA